MKNILKTLAVLLTVIFMASCGSSDDPKGVAEDFLKALGKQDYEKAKELSTEKTKSMLTLIESMAKMAKENGEVAEPDKMPDFEMGKCEVDGDKAVCHYTADGKEEKINLVKVDGDWKVDMNKEQ